MDATQDSDSSLGVPGTLHCESVPLDWLAMQVGTPAYVYSSETIRSRFSSLEQALRGIPHRVHYAAKANGSLGLLSLLKSLGARVDVVSGGELHRALAAGFTPSDIIFGGVGKTREELDDALSRRVHCINVESADEVRLIDELARRRGVVADIGIRVNPEVTVESFHDYTKTGEEGAKFGVPIDTADEVARLAHKLDNVSLIAIGMHIGSQLTSTDALVEALERLESLIVTLREQGIESIRYLDSGGGLFVPYGGEAPTDLPALARLLAPVVARLDVELILEPGRYLVAEAGALLTTVLYRKRSGSREILVVDAGMNDLIRPSHYSAYHRIEAVAPRERREQFDVVGPVCESGDFLALERELDDVGPGDVLCVHTAGAYGYAMASNYNARPRPVEVLIDGERWAVITERETYADLMRRETATPTWRNV